VSKPMVQPDRFGGGEAVHGSRPGDPFFSSAVRTKLLSCTEVGSDAGREPVGL
jgi:hypothetical protein